MSIARCAVVTAFVSLALALSGRAAAAVPAKCTLVRIAEWQIRQGGNVPVVDGAINGQNVGVLLDTGSGTTLIVRSAALRLGLVRYDAQGHRMLGVGGETAVESVTIDELKIGDAVRRNWRMFVAGDQDFGDIAVILGDDFFRQVDIEFDLAHNSVRLFQAKDCEGAALAYWASGDIGVVEIEAVSDAKPTIELSVEINRRPVRAQLDSGAFQSVLTQGEAAALGFTAESPGVGGADCGKGLGERSIESRVGQFESFGIGNEVIRNPRIHVADLWRYSTYTETGSRVPIASVQPQMLLGADFLRSHRVFVAHSQRKMYFTYAGGTVFPVAPAKACNDRPPPASDARPVPGGN
ncbi:MAG TPA: retroviral-like aspartic protease family protein [Casimicrobiaceae bacterium]